MSTVDVGNNMSDHLPVEVMLATGEVLADISDSDRTKDTLYSIGTKPICSSMYIIT